MYPDHFAIDFQPQRIVFGNGRRREIAAEMKLAGWSRAVIVTTPPILDFVREVEAVLGNLCIAVLDKAVMHVPVDVAAEGVAHVKRLQADCVIAVGGGSSIGLAKAIALETSLPIIAVPTTLAGSEMTNMYGLTEGQLKRTGSDNRVLPRLVIYDPELTVSLPPQITGPSGINALAHAVEALYAERRSPVTDVLAEEAILAIASSLPVLASVPSDLAARQRSLVGAMLCGKVLSMAGVSLHHKLCHTLGGTFNLPHAETHSVILPYATHYNAAAAPAAMERIGRALKTHDPSGAIFDLVKAVGAPTSLAALGFREADIDRAADIACAAPYYNPQPVERMAIVDLLWRAFRGERPSMNFPR